MEDNITIGIDVGGTHIAFGVVDGGGKFLAKRSIPTRAGRPFGEMVQEIVETAKLTAADAGIDPEKIRSIGIGVPSTIDPKTNRVVFANNLGWQDLDLIEEFKKHWNLPVFIENDADCAALAEALEDKVRGKNVLLITIGTGFGGAYIFGGKIFKGGDNSGFEPGHSILVHGGLPCTCGNKGCVEAYASVTALIGQTKTAMEANRDSLLWQECSGDLNKVDGRTAFDTAGKGDETARSVVQQFISYVALAIANLITLLRPELIIIGGGLSGEGDNLLRPLSEMAKDQIYAGDILGMPPIIQAKLGNDAGIIGAALLGRQ
jgi:glucokinase